MDTTDTDDESIIGEECHIIAREDDGPRGDTTYSIEKRDKYENLILLCNIHHKVIDDQQNTYTVEKLKEIKNSHINWIDSSLNIDKSKQSDDEVYSEIIEEFSRKADIENWIAWTSWVLGNGDPSLAIEVSEELKNLKIWLFSRIWPRRYPELEAAFENFTRVLNDFLLVFHKHSVKERESYITEKFYKRLIKWDPDAHSKLLAEYEFHVALVEDLILELTRAANYICDKARQLILKNYRMQEGILLVEAGPFMDLTIKTYRVEYKKNERKSDPYPGLNEFKKIRADRDFSFGAGVDVEDAKKTYGIDYA